MIDEVQMPNDGAKQAETRQRGYGMTCTVAFIGPLQCGGSTCLTEISPHRGDVTTSDSV